MTGLTLRAIAQTTTPHSIATLRYDPALVQPIQAALRGLGFLLGRADGLWGPMTAAAYCAFAHRFDLNPDELSPRAADLLLKAIPDKPSVSPFEDALAFTLRWEKGYVRHPTDHGGETNQGITAATYQDYLRHKGLPPRSVRSITDAEVADLYKTLYWQPAHCDQMQRPLAIAQFDTAVNFGVQGSILFLQQLLRVEVDGTFGTRTQEGLEQADQREVARRYGEIRVEYRHRRVKLDPSQNVFLKDWVRRDYDLCRYVLERI
jgi:peptidoglycan hydrolase-like protein with peptidoglycan-binding domain